MSNLSQRIAEALDLDLADPEVRFRLRLAAELLSLDNKSD